MVYKKTMLFHDFAAIISAMAGYYNELQNDSEWGEHAKLVNSIKEKVLQYAYIPDLEESGDCTDRRVHYTIADDELRIFYSFDANWREYDPAPMDLKDYFLQKQKHRIENYEKERQQILEEYQNYLESDEVDARGKKSKADFARKHGYNPNNIGSWIAGRNRP